MGGPTKEFRFICHDRNGREYEQAVFETSFRYALKALRYALGIVAPQNRIVAYLHPEDGEREEIHS
jgi:hypothetical protein